jgi:hypothetical protein
MICLLALLWATHLSIDAQAATLGRFFFTPKERATLDRTRTGSPEVPTQTIPVEIHHKSEVNGYLTRSDGQAVLWIDGEPQEGRQGGQKLTPSVVQTPTRIVIRRTTSPSGAPGSANESPKLP